jgi:hypothetical protein
MPRARKKLREKPGDHTWVLHKTEDRKTSKIDLPTLHGNPAFTLKLKMDFILCESFDTTPEGQPTKFQKAKLFRRCSVCGMELIGGTKPTAGCKETVVSKVMSS